MIRGQKDSREPKFERKGSNPRILPKINIKTIIHSLTQVSPKQSEWSYVIDQRRDISLHHVEVNGKLEDIPPNMNKPI